MAKGLEIKDQFTLVNAPAGSGKTTAVSKTIKSLIQKPIKKILCITYTNRAAEELAKKIDDERVEIGTIHSFIGNFMRPFFLNKSIIDYFGEFYHEKIEAILNRKDEKGLERIERYKNLNDLDSDCIVTKDTIMENISSIDYGETPFSSFMYGKLSHDDLLIFSKEALEKFPKLKKIITQRYSYVFVDEYQDTQAEILELFYRATLGSKTKLVLLGDEMQQIYQGRVEGFKHIIDSEFIKNESLKNNWRSRKPIVNVLNNLYFDSLYKQDARRGEGQKPKVHIVDDVKGVSVEADNLQLVLYNSDLFKEIDAYNLYSAYNCRYKLFDKYNAKEILSDMTLENPDDLMVLLLFITEISNLYETRQYSKLIQKVTTFKFANKEIWKIKKHSDKLIIRKYLEDLSNKIREEITIRELLQFLRGNKIVETEFIDRIIEGMDENIDFKEKINSVYFIEFSNCYREIRNPNFSTQHAVKGEGYDYVTFKASDGSNPNVKLYLFFEMLSKGVFGYQELMTLDSIIKGYKQSFSDSVGIKPAELNKGSFTQYNEQCEEIIISLKNSLTQNEILYKEFFIEVFEVFEAKKTVTAFKECIKSVNRLEGVLLAYKLFYVGCSRAKEKLNVYVCYNGIQKFEEEFTAVMEEIGFEVVKLGV
ncbi:TPA: ATP-dependent helicase [Bacillus mycoides]|uniref:ATP-dependent helicase n=1 Tax=Bacillus sp. FSL P2-0099 TaxID=2921572 RepID=UPI0030FBF2FD|nr:ATP-dependent helicase [Bacillus mycoides]